MSHEFFGPFERSGDGWTGRGDAVFGTEVERGFCDCDDTGAEVIAAGLAEDRGARITGGTGASVFFAERDDGLLGDAMGGTFASGGANDGVDDGLLGGGTS